MWFEILLFIGKKVHFWILYSFLPLVFFILASFNDIQRTTTDDIMRIPTARRYDADDTYGQV
jgi:hypothetical protein